MLHDVVPASGSRQTAWLMRRVVSYSDALFARFLPDTAVLAEGTDVSGEAPWMGKIDAQLPAIRAEAEQVLMAVSQLPPFGEVATVILLHPAAAYESASAYRHFSSIDALSHRPLHPPGSREVLLRRGGSPAHMAGRTQAAVRSDLRTRL